MKISILTATYNSGKTIRDTLNSVLRQSYQDYELIIKDGGSKDNTVEICREMEPLFAGKMKILSEPDKGIYDAMNKAISMSTGEVIGILNSDDFYTSDDILQQVADKMQNPQLDAVYGDIHYVSANDLTKCVRYYSSKRFKPSLIRLGYMPAHPSFYCRRELYEKFGTFDTQYKIASDFDLMVRFFCIGKINTEYMPVDFVTMRMGGASTAGAKSHLTILKDHQKSLKKHGIYSNVFLESFRYLQKLTEFKF